MPRKKKPDLSHIIEPLRDLAVPLEGLVLDPVNARAHDEANIQAIKHSFEHFRQRLPIVVQETGQVVRAGNGRVMAARQLGWTHIAAVVTDDEDAMAAAFAIADNRTAELATWNPENLAVVTEQLSQQYDLTTLGWDPEQLEQITAKYDVAAGDMPTLAEGKSPFEQITFTMTHDQATMVRKALDISKGNGPFGDTGNPNSNGNAIARICAEYCER